MGTAELQGFIRGKKRGGDLFRGQWLELTPRKGPKAGGHVGVRARMRPGANPSLPPLACRCWLAPRSPAVAVSPRAPSLASCPTQAARRRESAWRAPAANPAPRPCPAPAPLPFCIPPHLCASSLGARAWPARGGVGRERGGRGLLGASPTRPPRPRLAVGPRSPLPLGEQGGSCLPLPGSVPPGSARGAQGTLRRGLTAGAARKGHTHGRLCQPTLMLQPLVSLEKILLCPLSLPP